MSQRQEKQHNDVATTPAGYTKPLRLVVDTNVILDWLIFADPLVQLLGEAIATGQVVMYSHAPARDELQRVLGYAALQLEPARQAAVLDRYQSCVHTATLPVGFAVDNLLLPAAFPCCKDPDDQPFLALAFHTRADALITRDRAVLALCKRARKFGVTIVDVRQLPAFLTQAL